MNPPSLPSRAERRAALAAERAASLSLAQAAIKGDLCHQRSYEFIERLHRRRGYKEYSQEIAMRRLCRECAAERGYPVVYAERDDSLAS